MENKGLLFIPDISGFTKFINTTEINHSRLIIQELLELLINSNQIGLEVSEIEGDAILFYKFGESPDLAELYKQVEKMFTEFHKHLLLYNNSRYCYCKACNSVIDLSLKIITHYGEFTTYNVKNYSKLIGKDIIVAHQLLKNEIEQHEYWLITPFLSQLEFPPAGLAEWIKWSRSSKPTETGEISFYYTQLSQLKNKITPLALPLPVLSDKIKVLSLSQEYETDIITLFHACGDFNYRHLWLEGVKKVEEVNHYLPRVGMKCRCILENGETNIYSSSYSYSSEKIEFSETDEQKNNSTYYTLEKIGDKKAKLTLDIYQQRKPGDKSSGSIEERKKNQDIYQKSLLNLTELVKEIKLPA